MGIKKIYESSKEIIGGIALVLGLSLIIAIGIKWVLSFVLIPLLLLLTLLGINITFEPDTLSTSLSILSFIIAFVYFAFSDVLYKKLIKKYDSKK